MDLMIRFIKDKIYQFSFTIFIIFLSGVIAGLPLIVGFSIINLLSPVAFERIWFSICFFSASIFYYFFWFYYLDSLKKNKLKDIIDSYIIKEKIRNMKNSDIDADKAKLENNMLKLQNLRSENDIFNKKIRESLMILQREVHLLRTDIENLSLKVDRKLSE